MAASVFVGARTVCISISQAGADLKQLHGVGSSSGTLVVLARN